MYASGHAPGYGAPPVNYPVPPGPAGYVPAAQGMYAPPGVVMSPPQQYAPQPAGYRPPAAYGGGFAQQPPQQAPPPQQRPGPRHKGTIPPGQMVKVGNNVVRVERYLSEGGYAHVYLTSSDKPIYPPPRGSTTKGRWGEKGFTEHCLKRIAFKDEAVWADVSKEIEVMKSLPPSPHLVQFLDSAHNRLPNGTHEVFILMEFCSGGGIIDLLNKRLRDRLKEIEILNIFTDVCEAVAAMHACSPSLLHRDLKIENVLSHPLNAAPTPGRPTPLTFKLCDFGSTTFPASHPPTSKAQADALAADLNKHTTLQYRSPEMVEPMLGLAVGLPSDVWALGVLLYKLCYYTTPFEEHGTLAIVNAKYTFPQFPIYSPKLQHLIASMLVEHPARRPTVFEVLKVAHEMSGTRPLIDYPAPNRNIRASGFQQAPPKPAADKHNALDFTDAKATSGSASAEPPLASTITPQRRGRPNRDSISASQPPQVGRLPPMPQLPPGVTATSPAPAPSQIGRPKLQLTGDKPAPSTSPVKSMYGTVGGFAGAKPRPQSSYMPSKPVLQRLNVTGGDKSQRNTPSPQTGTDAFGLPSKSSKATHSPGGFGDAFGAPIKSPATANTPGGFRDSFGSARTPTAGSRQFSDSFGGSFTSGSASRQPPPPTLPAGVSGFGDSFTGAAKAKTPSPSTIQKPPSPVVRPPSPKPLPASELSFEQRFPSIDDLEGEKTSASPPATSPKPTHTKRLSLVKANLTGGNLGASHKSPETMKPIPRSTQVTGTAFKADQNLRPPLGADSGSPSPTADYLDLLGDDEDEPARRANNDFMGDDEGSSQVTLPSLRPQLSNQKMSGSRFGVTPPVVAPKPAAGSSPAVSTAPTPAPTLTKTEATPTKLEGAAQRATLPPISAARPERNFNSEAWSPLEAMRNGNNRNAPIRPPSPSPPSTANKPTYSSLEIDSSDDEAVPEDAYRTEHRTGSQEHGSQSPGVSRRRSWFEQPLPSPGLQLSGRSRPQTMYAGSTNAPASASTADASDDGHTRRGSINDMVSRYESLSTGPSSPKKDKFGAANGHGHTRPAAGVVRKPSLAHKPPPTVAAKPQALRNNPHNTADRVLSAPGAGPASRDDASVPVTGMAPSARPPPATQPKPPSLRQAVKHGDMPQVDGYSKSSSGRSFPVTRSAAGVGKPDLKAAGGSTSPDQSTRARSSSSSTVPPPAQPVRRGSGSSSRSSSPEKQQPVNLLIQRWNKGEVKGKHGAAAGSGASGARG
ncbi:Ark- serine/threonine protein kinase [Vanrija albida]|uniref:non-specific serine/threonine protein kinase n=1 Tax=Vanrija albida TaxID=181172 RepID=A0ABR3PXJ9_9TREE